MNNQAIKTIYDVQSELLTLSENQIGRDASGLQMRCGELAEALGNALAQLRMSNGEEDYLAASED